MKVSKQFKNYFLAWKNCAASLKQGQIFLLFIVYAALQISFVFILMFFAYPPFSSFLVPLVQRFFGEPALHYPNNFLILPSLFFWVNLLLSGLLGVILIGATTNLFTMSYHNKPVKLGKGLGRTMPHYLILLAIWVVETGALLAVFIGVPALLDKIYFFTRAGNLPLQLTTSFIAIIVGSFFVYTTALIVLENAGPGKAVVKSLSMFKNYPLISILLIGIPNLIRMPIDLLSGKTQFLVSQFSPEIVAAVLILSILISVFANYFLVGTVTRYFLSVRERS